MLLLGTATPSPSHPQERRNHWAVQNACVVCFNLYYCGARRWDYEAEKLLACLRERVRQAFLYLGVKPV